MANDGGKENNNKMPCQASHALTVSQEAHAKQSSQRENNKRSKGLSSTVGSRLWIFGLEMNLKRVSTLTVGDREESVQPLPRKGERQSTDPQELIYQAYLASKKCLRTSEDGTVGY